MRRFEVSGFPALDIEVEAENEEAAKEAWSAVLAHIGAQLEGMGLFSTERYSIDRAFFTDPADQMPGGTVPTELHVEPAFDPDAAEKEAAAGLPQLPYGSRWHRNEYGVTATDANVVLLACGALLDCTDAADSLRWRRTGEGTDITHWTAVIDPAALIDANRGQPEGGAE